MDTNKGQGGAPPQELPPSTPLRSPGHPFPGKSLPGPRLGVLLEGSPQFGLVSPSDQELLTGKDRALFI